MPRLGELVPLERDVGIGAEHRADLVDRPRVEQAFVPVSVLVGGVGVLGGEEPAGRMPQVAQHVLDGLFDDLLPTRLAEDQVGVQVDADQQRLVVEHLLEVGNEPFLVDRVAGEAAADVVVDPATRHRVEGRGDDGLRIVLRCTLVGPQHQVEAHRRWELRGTTEAAPCSGRTSRQVAASPG